ncbi:hypothetical protein GLOIN_2v1503556 [Rhizophagus irregularis DAOM 181602=DAOM 197198]|uniref:Uncharacterized protein n=1 Tax=Rhizophagus irregularis (strain DAOM 181602 / DAOM 197198 / MUCL 43194) TaxID=747089 RepID=A0A2P4QWB3_RHIID|nr:hypothetical protein GLOIN_2v1503556 [Rhizophagus irregularis DAOM 181602=DAOM 197198]POG81907.1 hypothetical protein GLOIN_2v1503556 [Rhizophagus irregularis DAOM 181602=DAOM 197198]|eukprot:XP_025188773.1 hypothetical protein GLOIN_2v1503556 [Rhizophagus irregularis DAOM 181602=DAOM 197198]
MFLTSTMLLFSTDSVYSVDINLISFKNLHFFKNDSKFNKISFLTHTTTNSKYGQH